MVVLRRVVAVGLAVAGLMAGMVAPVWGAEKKGEVKAVVPSYYGPQPAMENVDLTMYARIREEGLRHSHVMEFAGALSDGIGPRLTGSPNMAKANAWARDTMTAYGLKNAHLEDWGEFGMGWQQINTWARMVSPDPEPLWLQAAPWSPATSGPVTGEIAYVDLNTADLDKMAGTLKGKIVLLGAMRATPDVTEGFFKRYSDAELAEMEKYSAGEGRYGSPENMQRMMGDRARLQGLRAKAMKLFVSEGVQAILTPSRDGGGGGGTGVIFDDNGANLARDAQKRENAVPLPNAVMMIEHYNRLARLATNHVPVTLEVNIETKTTGDHEHGFDMWRRFRGRMRS